MSAKTRPVTCIRYPRGKRCGEPATFFFRNYFIVALGSRRHLPLCSRCAYEMKGYSFGSADIVEATKRQLAAYAKAGAK